MNQDHVRALSASECSAIDGQADRSALRNSVSSFQTSSNVEGGSFEAHMTVETEHGAPLPVRVALKRITPTRIDVHYPGALSRGVAVSVSLPSRDGGAWIARGWIKSCTPCSGHVHSIVVRLAEPIEMDRCANVAATAICTNRDESAGGVVAMCVNDRSTASFVERTLCDPAMTLLPVDRFDQLLEVVRHQEVDAVVLDREPASDMQHSASSQLHKCGLRGGLVMLSDTPAESRRLTTSGGLRVSALPRPVTAGDLCHELAWVVADMDSAMPSPIPSTLADPGIRALVSEYARQLPASIARLMQRRNAGEAMGVRVVLREWQTSGESFGFAALSQAAAEAMHVLHLNESIPEASIAVRKAVSVAQRIAQWQRVVDQASQVAA